MKTWDIFCRVIDNYGDIGVCWRLARQLANEHHLDVRVWVDELAALKQIWPETILAQTQTLAGVQVCIWQDDFATEYVADVVIEAFACHLPELYIARMKQVSTPPCWLNLEYLSAESWVEGCHQLTSMHPQNGLKKTFFFPGFSEKTGGLIREHDLLIRRDNFALTDEKRTFLTKLAVIDYPENSLIISLFSYENSAIAGLLKTWSQAPTTIICLVPMGKTLTSINTALNLNLTALNPSLNRGDGYTLGSLQIKVIPFLTQTDYDLLLWACDINFVRGEDSFVRAQWAAKPFVWHIYPQDEETHLIKLNAFLEKYTDAAEPKLATAIRQLWIGWNTDEDCSHAWSQLLKHHQQWLKHNQNWCKNLALASNLTSNLVDFCQKAL